MRGKIDPMQVRKAYRESEYTAPAILNLGTRGV